MRISPVLCGTPVSRVGAMAIDVVSVCATASSNQGSQMLAVVLSIMFSLYTVVAIVLSALTIYSTSQVNPTAPQSIATALVGGRAGPGPMGVVGSVGSAPPLVSLKASR